jgi:putative zinc finger/helix-turn-helix YgiT family protein
MFTKIREVKDECPLCEGMRNLIYGRQQEKIRVRGEEIDVFVNLFYCPTGDHYFQSFDDDEKRIQSAYREYRKRKGFLQPEEIKQIREQYKLSQRNFSRLLGWGDITIHRYESGAIQDDAHNDILLLIKSFEDFKKYFEKKKNSIDSEIVQKVEEKITEIERKKNIQTFNLWIKCCSTKKKKRVISSLIKDIIIPDYFGHNKDYQYCANNELALAA